jgi:hypothetical protein
MSETIADVTNARAKEAPRDAAPHRLEAAAAIQDQFEPQPCASERGPADATADVALARLFPCDTTPGQPATEERAPPSNKPFSLPVAAADVFVDDFILLGQGRERRLKALRRHLLHSVDAVLATPRAGEKRNEAVSLKKLLTGDGSWGTRKLILGWVIDTVRQTIELPPHRKQTLHDIFRELQGLRRVSAKKWRSILGKLRFVSLAIPGSSGLFSALQWALNQAGENRVRLNAYVRSNLDAFGRLAASLCTRPTHLAELVPEDPILLGATDAAKPGMGGVFFDHTGCGYVWREPFPQDVQDDLVSAENPNGRITNSDLEHAALLAQLDVMTHTCPVRYATLENLCDNTPAVSRTRKGAVSKPGAAAYLCQVASDHQRLHRYHHRAEYLPGPQNIMADDASRLQHLSPPAFHSHFLQQYPLAQPWTVLTLRPEMSSTLISALRCTPPSTRACPRHAAPEPPSSKTGPPSAANTTNRPTSETWKARNPACATSSYMASGDAGASTPKPANLSELKQWRPRSWPWARGSPHWVNKIHAKSRAETTTIPYSLISFPPSPLKTTTAPELTQPTSPSSNTFPPSWTPTTPSTAKPTSMPSTCASSVSTGSSGPPSTSTPALPAAPKLSVSVTSASPLTDA